MHTLLKRPVIGLQAYEYVHYVNRSQAVMATKPIERSMMFLKHNTQKHIKKLDYALPI